MIKILAKLGVRGSQILRSSCSPNGNEMTRRFVISFTGLVYLFLAQASWAFDVGILFLEEGVVPRTKVDSLKLHKDPSKNSPFVSVYETKKGPK
jgi:hypothetical protein